MTENRPNSSKFGSRPTSSTMREYSSGVTPCRCSVAESTGMRDYRFEDGSPVRATSHQFHRAFRMRHEPHHITGLVADAGDAVDRPVGIGRVDDLAVLVDIPEDDAVGRLELGHHLRRRVKVAFAVGDGHADSLSHVRAPGERRVGVLDAQDHVLAVELHVAIAQHRARQESALLQNLEPVADAEHGLAGLGKCLNGRHDGRKTRDGSRAEIVAVGKPSRQNHDVGIADGRVLVPDKLAVLTKHVFGGVVGVVIAVGSGEHDHREFHERSALASGAISSRKLSMTGFASTARETSLANASPSAAVSTFKSSSKYLPCRTSPTLVCPSECRASTTVLPWGSKTD